MDPQIGQEALWSSKLRARGPTKGNAQKVLKARPATSKAPNMIPPHKKDFTNYFLYDPCYPAQLLTAAQCIAWWKVLQSCCVRVLYFFGCIVGWWFCSLVWRLRGSMLSILEAPRVSWAPFWHLLEAFGRPFLEYFGARKRTWRAVQHKSGSPWLSDKKMKKKQTRQDPKIGGKSDPKTVPKRLAKRERPKSRIFIFCNKF